MALSKIEILDETVEYYSTNPRAIVKGTDNKCAYLTEEGYMCAVGRCLSNPKLIAKKPSLNTTDVRGLEEELGLDNILKDEYQGHEWKFWQDLQGLHDNKPNWNKDGSLSLDGKRSYDIIKQKINDNRY